MSDSDMNDREFEEALRAARAEAPAPPDALMARILADAAALQPARRSRGWIDALGGLPGLGGLVTATCVGFWIGVAPPAALPDFPALVLGQDTVVDAGASAYGWDTGEEG